MPLFVVTIAGFQIWQGVILKSIPQGVILIQSDLINNTAGYFFSDVAGWIIAAILSGAYGASALSGVVSGRRQNVAIRGPIMFGIKLVGVPAAPFLTLAIRNRDPG